MKIVKIAEIDRFGRLCAEISEKSKELAAFSAGSAVLSKEMVKSGDASGGATVAVSALSTAMAAYEDLLIQFERQSVCCLGEPRMSGESRQDYFDRICASEPLDLAIKNGIVFR